jgi:hypothetical protein
MGGVFGGSKKAASQGYQQGYAAAQAEMANAETTNANKGSTDLEKLKNKKSLQTQYGKAMSTDWSSMGGIGLGEDTTLSSGSLLGIGGTL